MTPKEKAKELVDKVIYEIMYNCQPTLSGMVAKQCALIAVDEMIQFANKMDGGFSFKDEIIFLQEVKQEIENL